jgi:hypothetical protein
MVKKFIYSFTIPILNPSSGLGLNEMCGCCKKDFGADYVI